MKTFYKLGDDEVFLTTGIYITTLNTSINATCSNGEPYGTLTVNPQFSLESTDLVYLNVNLFNIDVEKFFIENALGVKLEGREYKSGYLTYPLYKLNMKKFLINE